MRPEELVIARARALVPVLRERAGDCERRRTLPPETVADLRAAGFARILEPARFGGWELGLATLTEVARDLGHGCGSTAWCVALFAIHGWLTALFEERAQQEVFSENALVSAAFVPSVTARPESGQGVAGFRLAGTWPLASGCDHATWFIGAARVANGVVGPIPDVRCFLIPAASLRIEDTWFAGGLRGTGSHDVVVEDVFVPEHRVISFVDLVRGDVPGVTGNPSRLYRLPLVPVLVLGLSAVAIGLAREAIDTFRERAKASRGVEPPPREIRAGGPARLAEAMTTVDAADLLLREDVLDLTRRIETGGHVTRVQRARYRLDGAYVVASCGRAVGMLLAAAGTGALFDASPLQRTFRDLHAMAAHAMLHLDGGAELLGRLELGLPAESTPT